MLSMLVRVRGIGPQRGRKRDGRQYCLDFDVSSHGPIHGSWLGPFLWRNGQNKECFEHVEHEHVVPRRSAGGLGTSRMELSCW